jgi:hypothetical protein
MINRMRSKSGTSSGTAKPAKPQSTEFYEGLFNKFKDGDEASIGPEGMERLCEALGIDPADVAMLVFAWCLGAKQMGYFSREEWLSGVPKVGSVTSEAELKERVQELHKSTLRDPDALRELHQFAHKFCREERKKNIDVRPARGPLACGPLAPLCSPRGAKPPPAHASPSARRAGGQRADHADAAAEAAVPGAHRGHLKVPRAAQGVCEARCLDG